MSHQTSELPIGLAGKQYEISQVSLAVKDANALVPLYYDTFGWGGWKVFDHVPPLHHDTERHGRPTPYTLRGAEVQVGPINFELLQPLSGENVWQEHIDARGEGIASIATMFLTNEEGEAVKKAFRDELGLAVTLVGHIGPHIEYYYLDTEPDFGCLIESGSGHALDFVPATYEYPADGSLLAPSPVSGITYPITQVSLTVRDLEAKIKAYHRAFGWGPWRVYDSADAMSDCQVAGEPADFHIRWAETMVGDMNFELVEPLGGPSPWQEHLDTIGQGLCSISVAIPDAATNDRVREQFAAQGIGVKASGRIGSAADWFVLDTKAAFKCLIKGGTGHGFASDAPHTEVSGG
ncbi:MAG: VOC family protein [Actinomycetia bacterium]|nr:VOC family protein [Actinomycetes bacterium]